MTALEGRARDLAQRLGDLSGLGHQFAAHYAVRLAVLVGDNDVQYLDTTLERGTQADWEVVVLDDKKVVRMHVRVPDDPAGERTVTVDAWPRSTLQSLHIPAAVEQNEVIWGYVPDAGWPRGATIRLSYAGRQEVLELPLPMSSASGFQARMLGGVLPSLLTDLAATR